MATDRAALDARDVFDVATASNDGLAACPFDEAAIT
jgi:hypothetical protein